MRCRSFTRHSHPLCGTMPGPTFARTPFAAAHEDHAMVPRRPMG
jgi:hypothetical protein